MTNALNPESPGMHNRALELAAQQRELRRLGDLIAEPTPEQYDEDAIDLRRYWNVLLRRKWTVIAAVAIALLVALVATYNATPVYRSTLLLQIEPQTDQFLDYQQNVSLGEPVRDWDYYQTQYELLKSRSLARRVIDQLGLEATQRPGSEDGSSFLSELKTSVKGWFSGEDAAASTASGDETREKPNLEGALLGGLTISPVRDSRLLHIHYDSVNPKEAAAVANAVAENFINITLERRYEARAYAKKFLEERLQQVRANLEDSERKLIAYAKEREIVDLDDKLGSVMTTLAAMSSALVAAEAERIQAESEYTGALKGTGPSTLKILDSEVIQELKKRKGELELEYQELLRIYKPGYPKMQQLQRQMAEIGQQLEKETASIREAVEADYEAKVREQATLQARVSELKSEVLALQDRSTDYQALKREVDSNRELYDGLLQRMKEVGVVAGISTNNISIVDRALVPDAPYKPDLRKNLTVALALGLIAGILLAFLFEHMDDTVKSSEDVETRLRAPGARRSAPGVREGARHRRGRRSTPGGQGSQEPARRGGEVAADLARVLDRGGCAEDHARDQLRPGRGQDDNGHQHRDHLRAGRRQGADDRCRSARPFPAPCLRPTERVGPDQLPRRRHQTRRHRPADAGHPAVHHHQRPSAAEPRGAAVERQDARPAEPGVGALRLRHPRRAAGDRARRRPRARQPGQGDHLRGGCRAHPLRGA